MTCSASAKSFAAAVLLGWVRGLGMQEEEETSHLQGEAMRAAKSTDQTDPCEELQGSLLPCSGPAPHREDGQTASTTCSDSFEPPPAFIPVRPLCRRGRGPSSLVRWKQWCRLSWLLVDGSSQQGCVCGWHSTHSVGLVLVILLLPSVLQCRGSSWSLASGSHCLVPALT